MKNWNEREIEKLKLHYKQFNVPSDQVVKEKDILEKFTEWFNTKYVTDKQFSSEEVAEQLFKLRKSGKLPRIRK